MRGTPKAQLVVAAIVALGGLLFATGVASAHGGGKQRLRLVATQLQSGFADVGVPGTSVGDQFVFSESLARGRREVGTSGVVCTLTHIVPPYGVMTVQCVTTFSLRRGQITLQALAELQSLSDPGPFTLAITGGTGAYRSAGGEAVVRRGPGRAVYTLRIDSTKRHHHGRGHPRR